MRLQEKVAIVTGGGHGIGRAYCLSLAEEGARVAVADIDFPAARGVALEIRARKGQALALKVDVSRPRDTEAMARRTAQRFGGIDILVNNAAVFVTVPLFQGSFDEIPVAEWDRVMAVNVRGPWLCARAVLPYMKAQGRGKIINIASGVFFAPVPGRSRTHYVTSKGGVVGLTRSLAQEMGAYGICVNAIAPGGTLSATPEDPRYHERYQAFASRLSQLAIPRVEVPQDLVGTVIYLASSDSDFITGQTIVVDGGRVMH